MTHHPVVSHDEWIQSRRELLAKEKQFTALRDELAALRRDLPWERVQKTYEFLGPNGRVTFADIFDGKSQLIVYHFMFSPEAEQPCKSCSFWADGFNNIRPHLAARDVALVAISRAPVEKLSGFARRLGWTFPWYSSGEGDFNYDYGVSFSKDDAEGGRITYNYAPSRMKMRDLPGISVFYKDAAGNIFHSYSCYARGLDMLNPAYQYLDLVPKGRDEDGLSSPMAWVRYRDKYEN
ncbi:MAG: thioredoxin family protein [Hyphomicrobiales bacterium]